MHTNIWCDRVVLWKDILSGKFFYLDAYSCYVCAMEFIIRSHQFLNLVSPWIRKHHARWQIRQLSQQNENITLDTILYTTQKKFIGQNLFQIYLFTSYILYFLGMSIVLYNILVNLEQCLSFCKNFWVHNNFLYCNHS